MKNILLSGAITFLSIMSYGGCPVVTALIFHSGATQYDYTLAIHLTKNVETFHIQDSIFSNGVQIASGCNTFTENGTLYIEFNCKGAPTAKVTVYTQSCGNNNRYCTTVVTSVVGSLPVVISGFILQRSNREVITTWQTQQEVNSDRFEVERSFDNRLFQVVGTVASHGNSNVVNNYSYATNTDTRNTSFFRVKLIDKDGVVSFTPIKSVKGINANADYTLFPNPRIGNEKITITGLAEPATVQVLDNSGRLVKTLSMEKSAPMELGNLQKGTYIIRITGNISNETSVKKLTVIN